MCKSKASAIAIQRSPRLYETNPPQSRKEVIASTVNPAAIRNLFERGYF